MQIIEGASLAHVNVSIFYPLVGLSLIVPASVGVRWLFKLLGGR